MGIDHSLPAMLAFKLNNGCISYNFKFQQQYFANRPATHRVYFIASALTLFLSETPPKKCSAISETFEISREDGLRIVSNYKL